MMQSLLESLLNYIIRHHSKTLLTGLWNYVLTMRHHHELSPKRVMELRPNREAPLWVVTKRVMKLRSNHEAPPWDLTKRFMELRPKPYHNHVSPTNHKVIMHTNLMLIFITNHTIMFHMKDHTKLINSSPYNKILHAYSHTSYFK